MLSTQARGPEFNPRSHVTSLAWYCALAILGLGKAEMWGEPPRLTGQTATPNKQATHMIAHEEWQAIQVEI